MNPTPTFTQITAAPDAQPVWWIFPTALGIIFAVWFILREIDKLHAKRALDEAKAKAEAERRSFDEAMFGHLPFEANEYARKRMELHVACLRAGRPDLIVARAPKQEVIS